MKWMNMAAAVVILSGCQPVLDPPSGIPIAAGEITAAVRGNENRPADEALNLGLTSVGVPFAHKRLEYLSGLSALGNQYEGMRSALDNPRQARQSAGLNYEHVISTYPDERNDKAPRQGRYTASLNTDGSVTLTRLAEDDPWHIPSTFTYRAVAPHFIDFEFSATIPNASQFGDRRTVTFFFATYMRTVSDVDIHFRGIPNEGADVQWVTSPRGQTYRTMIATQAAASGAETVEWPRIAEPFYYGVDGEMALVIMLDHLWSADRETRFTVVTRKDGGMTPAWDFEQVAHNLVDGAIIHFRGRLAWEHYTSPEAIEGEYSAWFSSLR